MPEKLHPAVDHLLHSGKFVCRPNVEIFTEHELKDRSGKVVRKVTKDDLEKTAQVGNEKAKNGALSPGGCGHTYDDTFDAQGKLVRKFPEDQQPKPITYYYRYSVARNPHSGKWSLYADEWVQKTVYDAQAERMVDGLTYTATFPRRSLEIYHAEHWADWVALLRRAPRLDLGLELYAKTDPDHVLYSHSYNENPLPAIQMARGKTRYAYGTGDAEMDDPTRPPAASDAPAETSAGGAAETEGGRATETESTSEHASPELPPEHAAAAEQYAHHTFGMHHTRARALMHHMHAKYGRECGLDENMNAPAPEHEGYAMGHMSGTSVPPSPVKPGATRMQQDQAAIEHTRYAREVADLKAGQEALKNEIRAERELRLAAEEKGLHTLYERELMQLVYEGYEINAAEELKFVTDRKYSKQQFDDHIGILRRMPHAPLEDVGTITPLQREFTLPKGGPTTDPADDPEIFDKAQRYMRQEMSEGNEITWEQAVEKYSKNGVAK